MPNPIEYELVSSINQSANIKPLTREELADYLNVSTKTVARLGQEGLPENKIGGQYRYIVSKLEEWLLEHKYKNNAEPSIFSEFSISYDDAGKPYPLFTLKDVAGILECSRRTMYRRLKDDIPAFLIGGQSRFDKNLLERWLNFKQDTD